jgi:hypothetical protein
LGEARLGEGARQEEAHAKCRWPEGHCSGSEEAVGTDQSGQNGEGSPGYTSYFRWEAQAYERRTEEGLVGKDEGGLGEEEEADLAKRSMVARAGHFLDSAFWVASLYSPCGPFGRGSTFTHTCGTDSGRMWGQCVSLRRIRVSSTRE